jgi:SAM-dependent methyltransferase
LNLLDAQLYALTHRGNPGDVAHYVELCRGARSVLELGSGAGRVLCALAQPGRALHGLELDPGLFELGTEAVRGLPAASRRGVSLVREDMRDFSLGRRFERAILPYNALYCLLTPRDVQRCFRAVHAALEPGGMFGFDVWNADGFVAHEHDGEDDTGAVMRVQHQGEAWSVFERSRLGRSAGRLDVTYTYVASSRGTKRSQVLKQRYYRSADLLHWLERAGFQVTSKAGSFGGGRFGARSSRLVVTASARG